MKMLARLLVGSALLMACAPTEVVLAEIPPEPDGGGVPRVDAPCIDDSDCSPVESCSRPPGCMRMPGRCELTPLFCPNVMAPVCGCDGVTYWNDCVRRQARVPVGSIGECTASVLRCKGGPDPGSACPAGLFCRRISPPGIPCPMLDEGVCWAVPESCEGSERLPFVELCESGAKCIDLCTAIRSERPHRISDSPACR